MTVYVVTIHTRQAGTDSALFSDPGAAILWAKDMAKKLSRGRAFDENETLARGWLYHASQEDGFSIWVVETVVDKELQ